MTDAVLYDVRDGVAEIVLNAPDRLNALTEDSGRALVDGVARGALEARAILIRANGRAFCSGALLEPGRFALDDPDRDAGVRLEKIFNPLLEQIRASEVPIVTAVQGAAAGIGASIGLAGDLIVAGESAYFFLAFSKIGLVPDGGATHLLTRAVGRPRAMEMMLLGTRLPSDRALEWGLVNRVVPDAELGDAARELALQLAQGPRSLSLIRRLAWHALDQPFDVVLTNERVAQRSAGRTADFVEGLAAFTEKRTARFSGS